MRGLHPDRIATCRIALAAITWSSAIRPIDDSHLERLSAAEELPPIKVWDLGEGRYRGIDGFHRWRVAKERGDTTVQACVYRFGRGSEGQRAFEFEAVRSNLQHGLPLTREQRDQAIAGIWRRWGSHGSRTSGITLEQLAGLFNLTKPRIHQIIASTGGIGDAPSRRRTAHPGGFSPFGRFSAATHRMAKLLSDGSLIDQLVKERSGQVIESLRDLRALIDGIINERASPDQPKHATD